VVDPRLMLTARFMSFSSDEMTDYITELDFGLRGKREKES